MQVVFLTNQKDYEHYLARASGHYNLRKSQQFYISIFDFFRNTRYEISFGVYPELSRRASLFTIYHLPINYSPSYKHPASLVRHSFSDGGSNKHRLIRKNLFF